MFDIFSQRRPSAIDEILELALRRAEELGFGFRTRQAFEPSFFRKVRDNQQTFSLTSADTQTEYGFAIPPGSEIDPSACKIQVIHVATCGDMLDKKNWRMMTVAKGENGEIVVKNGC